MRDVERLRGFLALTESDFADGLGISRATYAKYKKAKNLSAHLSEKVYRYFRVVEVANNTFDNRESTKRWFHSEIPALGGKPAEVMLHEPGTTESINVLDKIRLGYFA